MSAEPGKYVMRVRDAQGNLLFNVDDRLGRILGVFRTNGVGGSMVVPGFLTGEPFAIRRNTSVGGYMPKFIIDGANMYWTYSGTPTIDVLVFYGVF